MIHNTQAGSLQSHIGDRDARSTPQWAHIRPLMAYAVPVARWETAVFGHSDLQCHSQKLSYPMWTLLISTPASQLPSSLLAYFSQVCHVRLHIILSQPYFPTIPNRPSLFGLNFFHPAVLLPRGKALHYMAMCCIFMLCGKRWGGCWGVHFNRFTAVLLGLELSLGGVGFPCLAKW